MHSKKSSQLTEHVALITGASQGIGKMIAHHLALEGVHLVLTARSEIKLQELEKELNAHYPNVQTIVVPADVTDPNQVKRVIQSAVDSFKKIDILINNAGVAGKIALLQEIPLEEIERTIDTNLKGPIYYMREVIPLMVSSGGGTIININSVAGKTAFPYWSIYDASKFGLRALTESVGEEQRQNNIKVVGIYPGAVDTPLWNSIELDNAPNQAGMLDPESVAETVVHILKQPGKTYIPEVTVQPLQPAL